MGKNKMSNAEEQAKWLMSDTAHESVRTINLRILESDLIRLDYALAALENA